MRSASAPSLAPLVFASGASALVYESVWLRSFGLVFGNTTDAVALVLAIFMAGLALGGAASARGRFAGPLRAYAFVEMGVAGTALATLPLLGALPRLYAAVDGLRTLTGGPDLFARAVAATLVLLPPTALLGATVPLAVEALARRGLDVNASLGRLYRLNTLGGALGTALVPSVLLPALGVVGALVAAAFSNLLVGALAWRWSASEPDVRARETAPVSEPRPPLAPVFALLAAASGAFTFAIEVIWTRALALVVGSSVYAFASMLLAVLLGIAAGAAVYERLRPRLARPATVLGGLFVACGFLALASVVVVGRLPPVLLSLMKALPAGFTAYSLAGLLLSLVALLPVTLLLGVTFPLLLHQAEGSAAGRTGRLYAWNTAGAVAGALLADLLLVGTFGLEGGSLVVAGIALSAGGAALATAAGWRPSAPTGIAAATLAGAALLTPLFRPWDRGLLTAGVYLYGLEWKDRPEFRLPDFLRERQLLFYEEGREAVVAVSERAGYGRRFLSVNGKTDAGSGAEDVLTQKFIAHVPLLLHEAPRRALVVGWGAGATAATAALYPLERIECVEIEPATYRAAPYFDALSRRVRDDPRFRIVFRDGRTHLLRTGERYDVIVSEPSNPWITGVANLFTREFYEMALARLAPRGLFGQWFHYYRLETTDVKVELRTFASVFPHTSLWLVPPVEQEGGPGLAADLLLVGSREPQVLDWRRLREAFAGPPGDDLRATRVLTDEAALVAAWAMGDEALLAYTADPAFPRGTPLNTDGYPRIELGAPRRNVMPTAEVVARAQAQHESFVAAASPPAMAGLDGAASGGFWLALGERYLRTAQAPRAAWAFERAVAADPSLATAYEELGHLYVDRRDYAAAEAAHRALLRLRPDRVDAWLRFAAVLARQSKWREARDAIDRARRLDPHAPVDPALVAFLDQKVAEAPTRD